MRRIRLACRAFVAAFAGSRRGATAVEFAIVAAPFFLLMFGVMELSLMFMASTTIEAATITAARQIRTGQLQTAGTNTAAGFKTLVCNGMSWISASDCTANLQVDVRTFNTFTSISTPSPITNNAIDPTKLSFDSGGSCSIVLVRVFYPWTLLTPTFDPGLPSLGPTQRLLTQSVAFRNEDWDPNTPPCS
ncbi:MAG: TadE/TadG family type IV pilus assembly protein [Caulobacterales bacterium]